MCVQAFNRWLIEILTFHSNLRRFRLKYIKAVYCHPAYLTYMQGVVRNAGLDEATARIKIAERNISNLTFTDDTTLMAESKELKSLLMRVEKESEKVGLKLNIQKTKNQGVWSHHFKGETVETVTDFILGELQNHCG